MKEKKFELLSPTKMRASHEFEGEYNGGGVFAFGLLTKTKTFGPGKCLSAHLTFSLYKVRPHLVDENKEIRYVLIFDVYKKAEDIEKGLVAGRLANMGTSFLEKDFFELVNAFPGKGEKRFVDWFPTKGEKNLLFVEEFLGKENETKLVIRIDALDGKGIALIEVVSKKLGEKFVFKAKLNEKDLRILEDTLSKELPEDMKKELGIE
jgi:hypothetical protein